MEQHPIDPYLGLLEIRLRATRRNAYITGSIFTVALLSFFLLGMIGSLHGLEIFVASALLIAFALSFIAALMRLEIAKALNEFASVFLKNEKAA